MAVQLFCRSYKSNSSSGVMLGCDSRTDGTNVDELTSVRLQNSQILSLFNSLIINLKRQILRHEIRMSARRSWRRLANGREPACAINRVHWCFYLGNK